MPIKTKEFFMPNQMLPTAKVLRAKQASEYLGVAKSTFWRWVQDGKISKGKRIGSRCTLWRVEDLDEFLNKQFAE